MGVNTRLEKAAAATALVLTDSSSGTASQTIAAIGATYDQDEVRNAVASLADEVNKLIADNAELRRVLNAGG
jgi:hypothetical protein